MRAIAEVDGHGLVADLAEGHVHQGKMDIFNERIRGKNEPLVGLVSSNGRIVADADRIGG